VSTPHWIELDLDVAAQVDDVGDADALDEVVDVCVGEVLEVVGPQQPAGGDVATVGGRQAPDITHVDDAVEVDPEGSGHLLDPTRESPRQR